MSKSKIISIFQKYSKLFVVVLGMSVLVVGVFALNSSLYQSKDNKLASRDNYDFYLQYNKLNKLSPSYFTSKVNSGFEKIKIDTLPNHSDILLNNNKIKAGDEVSFVDLAKLVILPNIDEYDNFVWSAVNGSNIITKVVSKFGVGGSGSINKDILSNESMTVPLSEFQAFLGNDPTLTIRSFRIDSLPSNGILSFNGNPVSQSQIINPNQIGTLIYTPNFNYIGIDEYFLSINFINDGIESNSFPSVLITINNRPPVTLPQSINAVIGQTVSFAPFIASDEGTTSFTISNLPVGFDCSGVNNIISCVIDASVIPGSYTFNVTPVDNLNLAGQSVVYTINVAATAPVSTNGGGTIIIAANSLSSTNSISSSNSTSTYSVSSIASSPITSLSSLNLQSTSSLVSALSINNVPDSEFDEPSISKGVATVRTGGY